MFWGDLEALCRRLVIHLGGFAALFLWLSDLGVREQENVAAGRSNLPGCGLWNISHTFLGICNAFCNVLGAVLLGEVWRSGGLICITLDPFLAFMASTSHWQLKPVHMRHQTPVKRFPTPFNKEL